MGPARTSPPLELRRRFVRKRNCIPDGHVADRSMIRARSARNVFAAEHKAQKVVDVPPRSPLHERSTRRLSLVHRRSAHRNGEATSPPNYYARGGLPCAAEFAQDAAVHDGVLGLRGFNSCSVGCLQAPCWARRSPDIGNVVVEPRRRGLACGCPQSGEQ